MSSDLSFRVYPGTKGPPFQLVREGLLLAPYTVLMLAATVLVFGILSGWRLWLAVAAMLPLHVYLTTDLLLPHFRKAEVMGTGLIDAVRQFALSATRAADGSSTERRPRLPRSARSTTGSR